MKPDLTAQATILVQAPVDKVWEALTTPEQIKQYLFGTETVTDWREGSDIRWRGQWQGKAYEDKGRILAVEKDRLLQYTYWSSLTGKADRPENYYTVTTRLTRENDRTWVTIQQGGNESPESRAHAEQNWNKVLSGLKTLLEKKPSG